MKIEFIYTKGFENAAKNAVKKSLEFKNSHIVAEEDGYTSVDVGRAINCDTAVIFITDDVADNKKWHERVDSISGEKKIVLLSRIISKDIRLSAITPESIRKINSIKLAGDDQFDELWDVLNADKDDYIVINALSAMVDGWEASGYSKVKLLHGFGKIFKYQRMIRKRRNWVTKPFFKNKIERIIPYLNKSFFNELNIGSKNISHISRLVTFLSIAFVLIYASVKNIPKYFTIAGNASAVCAGERSTINSPVQALKAMETVRNPFVNDILKDEAFKLYNYYMCDNWPNTTIGAYFKYAQNDVRVGSDERYLYTASGDGSLIKWDTYNGEIVKRDKISRTPLYVLDTYDNDDQIIAASEDGSIFYCSGGNWISAEKILSDYGYAVEISLYENNACILTDQNNVVFLSVYSDRIEIKNSMDFYYVYSIEQGSDQALILMHEDDHSALVSVNSTGETTDKTVLDYSLSDVCTVDIKDNKVLFADSQGSLYIYYCDDQKAERLPVNLSNPLILSFVNDSILYYCDRDKGNCIYDYSHNIDLGSILPEAPFTSYAACGGNTVACISSQLIFSENIKDLIPVEHIDPGDAEVSYEGQESFSGGMIQSAEIISDTYVLARFKTDETNEFNYLIDGGHYYVYTSPDKRTNTEVLDELDFTYSMPCNVVYTGVPTVVGIPADGNTLIIGTSDGWFYEIAYMRNEIQSVSQRQIPTRSPIIGVYQINGSYYIKDQDGLYWKVRNAGIAYSSDEAFFGEIRDKLHMGMSDEIKDCVSNAILNEVDVKYIPGHNGKEWK